MSDQPTRKLNRSEYDAMVRNSQFAARPVNERNFGRAGSLNVYVCDLCGNFCVAVLRDPGTAPQMLPCPNEIHLPPAEPEGVSDRIAKRQVDTRDGSWTRTDIKRMPSGRPITLRSAQFRVPDFINADQATIELYRPDFAEYDRLPPGSIARHIEGRGLWFRELGKSEGEGLAAIAATEQTDDAES